MSATAACPKCDPCNPELDEDGRPYACYFCGDSGTVDKASADAYWQDATDAAEYRGMLPVVDGKHHLPRHDQESGDCHTVISPLLPGACFANSGAPYPWPRTVYMPDEDEAQWEAHAEDEALSAALDHADPLDPNAYPHLLDPYERELECAARRRIAQAHRAPRPFPTAHVSYGYSDGIDDDLPF